MAKRIVFTGGTGKAGRHVVPYLVGRGHEVLNVDLTELGTYKFKCDPHPSTMKGNIVAAMFANKNLTLMGLKNIDTFGL